MTYVYAKLLELCLTLCDPTDCSPPGLLCPWNSLDKNTGVGSVSSSRGSSWPRDQIVSLMSPALAGGFFLPLGPPGKPVGPTINTIKTKKSWQNWWVHRFDTFPVSIWQDWDLSAPFMECRYPRVPEFSFLVILTVMKGTYGIKTQQT